METVISNSSDTRKIFVVVSTWPEDAYARDSYARNGYSYTLHEEREEAERRAEQESEFCLHPFQVSYGRKCAICETDVPLMFSSEEKLPLRWISDRIAEISRRAWMHEQDNLHLLIDMAFHKAGDLPHKLLFLQAAGCAARKNRTDLTELLKIIASMPSQSVFMFREQVEKLLGSDIKTPD